MRISTTLTNAESMTAMEQTPYRDVFPSSEVLKPARNNRNYISGGAVVNEARRSISTVNLRTSGSEIKRGALQRHNLKKTNLGTHIGRESHNYQS